ncbi:MAG: hypothetical protein K2Y71_00735 [Xanthobacteraceae bacterium]|nr:hypothetical protein [Xanthobacteraceae bacterium]
MPKAKSKAKPKAKSTSKAKPKSKATPTPKPQAKPRRLDPLCGQCGARHPFGTDCDPAQLMSFARVQRNLALIDQATESQQSALPASSKNRAAGQPRRARR